MKLSKSPSIERRQNYHIKPKGTSQLNNNFVNSSFSTSSIRSRQDVPPPTCAYKQHQMQLYCDEALNRGRAKTRNYIDFSKFQNQVQRKIRGSFDGEVFCATVILVSNQNQNNAKHDTTFYRGDSRRYDHEWRRPDYLTHNSLFKYH